MQPPLALLPIFVAAGMHKTGLPKPTTTEALPVIPTLPPAYPNNGIFGIGSTNNVPEAISFTVTGHSTTSTFAIARPVNPSTFATILFSNPAPTKAGVAQQPLYATAAQSEGLPSVVSPLGATEQAEKATDGTGKFVPTSAQHATPIAETTEKADSTSVQEILGPAITTSTTKLRVKRNPALPAIPALPSIAAILAATHVDCVTTCDVADVDCLALANYDVNAMHLW